MTEREKRIIDMRFIPRRIQNNYGEYCETADALSRLLKDHPERDAILNGEKRFDKESAIEIYDKIKILPNTHFGYVPCLCGKSCETVCYKHLKEVGRI